MSTPNRFFEDAARVAGGAIGTLTGVRRELENLVRCQIDRLLSGMDLVTREEFDAVKEMAANARNENDRLEARIAALETAKATPQSAKKRLPAKKPARKRAKKPS